MSSWKLTIRDVHVTFAYDYVRVFDAEEREQDEALPIKAVVKGSVLPIDVAFSSLPDDLQMGLLQVIEAAVSDQFPSPS